MQYIALSHSLPNFIKTVWISQILNGGLTRWFVSYEFETSGQNIHGLSKVFHGDKWAVQWSWPLKATVGLNSPHRDRTVFTLVGICSDRLRKGHSTAIWWFHCQICSSAMVHMTLFEEPLSFRWTLSWEYGYYRHVEKQSLPRHEQMSYEKTVSVISVLVCAEKCEGFNDISGVLHTAYCILRTQ